MIAALYQGEPPAASAPSPEHEAMAVKLGVGACL
jgi:phosphonate transport system ATP-binding protein